MQDITCLTLQIASHNLLYADFRQALACLTVARFPTGAESQRLVLLFRHRHHMRLGQQLMRLLRGDRVEILKEVGQRMPAIQIVEKRLHRHPGLSAIGQAKADPGKTRRPAHDLGINDDDARLHATSLARRPRLARFDSAGSPTFTLTLTFPRIVTHSPWSDSPHSASVCGCQPSNPPLENSETMSARAGKRRTSPRKNLLNAPTCHEKEI